MKTTKALTKTLLVAVLCAQTVILPTGRSAQAAPAPMAQNGATTAESNAVLRLIRGEVAKNPAYFYADDELSAQQADENKSMALQGVQDILAKLDDSSYSLESIRQQIVSQVLAEEEAQQIELKYVVQKMPAETLDQLFVDALKRGTYDQTLRQDYDAAYTQREKRDVVLNLVQADLGRVKSVTLKKLSLLDREGLKRELKLTQSLLNTKGRDTWKIVLVVVIAVAAAGLVSWAVVSATKAHWEKKQQQLEDDFRNREQQMGQDYANREQELQAMFEERNRLREQGYVWAVCGTTTTTKSVACSYDQSSHTGNEVCVTHCLKNPSTGDMQQATTSCSSAYIPNNCMLKNPYVDGYDNGYHDGYYDGFYTGYDDAYYAAYDQYWDQGYDAGYLDGWDWGYNDGFSDGLSQAAYDDSASSSGASAAPAVMSMSIEKSNVVSLASFKAEKAGKPAVGGGRTVGTGDQRATGYKTGYREGYAVATQIRIGG